MDRDAKLHHDPYFFNNLFFNSLVGLHENRLLKLIHKIVIFSSILCK